MEHDPSDLASKHSKLRDSFDSIFTSAPDHFSPFYNNRISTNLDESTTHNKHVLSKKNEDSSPSNSMPFQGLISSVVQSSNSSAPISSTLTSFDPQFSNNSTPYSLQQTNEFSSTSPRLSNNITAPGTDIIPSIPNGPSLLKHTIVASTSSPLSSSSSFLPPVQSPNVQSNNNNNSINSPDSVTFASPQNSHWWYNIDLDNSQHGIQSEEALLQQTFHSDYSPHYSRETTNNNNNNIPYPSSQSITGGMSPSDDFSIASSSSNIPASSFSLNNKLSTVLYSNNDISSPSPGQSSKVITSVTTALNSNILLENQNSVQDSVDQKSMLPTSLPSVSSSSSNNFPLLQPFNSHIKHPQTQIQFTNSPTSHPQKEPQPQPRPQPQPQPYLKSQHNKSSEKIPISTSKSDQSDKIPISNSKTGELPETPIKPTATERKKSPSIPEAAAMAIEIIAQEQKNPHPHSRRFRPCDSCRKRKVRCIMLPSDTGRCLHCEVKKQTCTFLEAPVRKNKAKKVDKNAPVAANGSSSSSSSSTEKLPKLKYEDYASLGGHALLKKALSLQYPRSAYYIGPTSIHDARLLEATSLDSQDKATLIDDIELRKVSSDIMFKLHNDYSEELYARSIQNCDAVEAIVSPHGQDLIDLYFRIVHPSFPILHKRVFLEKYKRTHREFLAPLLAAVYILALNWWDFDPKLSKIDKKQKPDSELLLKLATSTFVDALDRPKLTSVQAGLLLLQCKPTRAGNWMLCSQVVAIAEELALSMDCGKWKIPRWERGIRRRLSWAVWMQDQWYSLLESRPSHTDRHVTWILNDLTVEDFPERSEYTEDASAEVVNGRLLFCEMIKLTEIVEDIRRDLFSIQSLKTVIHTEDILEHAKPLQLRLRNWYHSLPKSLFMSASSHHEASSAEQAAESSNDPRPRKLSANGYLHLAYFAAEITLHRRIIRSLNVLSSPDVLINLCREAAKARLIAAINFVSNLRPEHLQAFWYSSSYSNFSLIGSFAGLLYVTSKTSEEATFYKEKLSYYRSVLRGPAEEFEFEPMRGALRMLNEVLHRVPSLLDDTDGEKIEPSHSNISGNGSNSHNSSITNPDTRNGDGSSVSFTGSPGISNDNIGIQSGSLVEEQQEDDLDIDEEDLSSLGTIGTKSESDLQQQHSTSYTNDSNNNNNESNLNNNDNIKSKNNNTNNTSNTSKRKNKSITSKRSHSKISSSNSNITNNNNKNSINDNTNNNDDDDENNNEQTPQKRIRL